MVAGSNPAGIANTFDDQSIAWGHPRFVLSLDPCCVALHASVSNSNALRPATNGSTLHERNTAFPASFASVLDDTDTLGAIALLIAIAVVFIAGKLNKRKASRRRRAC